MPRPSFNITIPAPIEYRRGSTVEVYDGVGMMSNEWTSGSSGGWVTPSFRMPTPYSLRLQSYRAPIGKVTYSYPNFPTWTPWSFTGSLHGGNSGFNPLNNCNEALLPHPSGGDRYSALRNSALTQARNQLRRSDLNLGVAWAERNSTMNLLANTANTLYKGIRCAKRGDVPGMLRALNVKASGRQMSRLERLGPHSRWLEIQYGWKPLLSDVYNATEMVRRSPPESWFVTSRARRTRELVGTSDRVPFSVEARGQGGVFVRIDAVPSAFGDVLAASGITNPVLIGWELMPWSFVADWAYGVGDWLSSLDALMMYSSTYYSISTFERIDYRIRPTPPSISGHVRTEPSFMEGRKVNIYLDREAGTSVPFPPRPVLKDPVTATRMASALSLLASVFSGKR